MISVAFDVDGTLIYQIGEKEDTPRYDVINFYHQFEKFGCTMYVWSSGGSDYANKWREKLGLQGIVVQKGSFEPDIAVDNEEVNIGKINIRV
jgi:hypothetical protein